LEEGDVGGGDEEFVGEPPPVAAARDVDAVIADEFEFSGEAYDHECILCVEVWSSAFYE